MELWRLGNHGLYSAAPNTVPQDNFARFPKPVHDKIAGKISAFDGVWIESKGPVLAIHHRANPGSGPDIYKAVSPLITPLDSYNLQIGNNVIEVKPSQANKGEALKQQMHLAPFKGRIPIMIGDDTTDEDGFLAAQDLGGLGIKIGYGETAALHRIQTISQLYKILETLR